MGDFDVFEGTVGKEMTFNVEIHNMGEADAFDVDFFDDAIEAEDGKAFKMKEGTFKKVIVPLAAGPMLMPSSIVTYTEEKSSSKKISVVGSVDGFNVMTATQANTKTLLSVGKYLSFGFCKTLGDWIRLALMVGIVGLVTVGKSTFTKAKKMKDARRRKLARRALGVEDIMKDE